MEDWSKKDPAQGLKRIHLWQIAMKNLTSQVRIAKPIATLPTKFPRQSDR